MREERGELCISTTVLSEKYGLSVTFSSMQLHNHTTMSTNVYFQVISGFIIVKVHNHELTYNSQLTLNIVAL